MKKFLLFMFCSFFSLSVMAQTYEKMWANVEAYGKKDLPKSALAEVDKIRQKAMAEKNDGQLLKAMLTARMLHEEVSPDSGKVAVEQMETALARETRPLQRAMWQNALARYFAEITGYDESDTVAVRKRAEYLRASLADIDLLARADYRPYLPVLEEGKDSKYYHYDLLHVLSNIQGRISLAIPEEESAQLLQRIADYYTAAGNREAALLTRLNRLDFVATNSSESLTKNRHFIELMKMKEEYKDLPLNVETYKKLVSLTGFNSTDDRDSIFYDLAQEGIKRYGKMKEANELRNVIGEMITPFFSIENIKGVVYPDETVKIKLSVRNRTTAKVCMYRLNKTAKDVYNNDVETKDLKGLQALKTYDLTFPKAAPYREVKDSLSFSFSEPGIYALALVENNKPVETKLIHVSRVFPVKLPLPDGRQRITFVDRKSGTPLLGGKLVIFTENNDVLQQKEASSPDEKGDFYVARYTHYNDLYFAQYKDDAYYPLSNLYGFAQYEKIRKHEITTHVFTDRAIYRPGQEVSVGVLAYQRDEDSTKVLADAEVYITLSDANWKELETLKLKTDAMGVVNGTFRLPENTLSGWFHINTVINGHGCGSSEFRVEEYKRPTFEVKLETPQTKYALGDTVRMQGTALTYTGLPVRNALVQFTVKPWSWIDEDLEEQTDTVKTDEYGRFVLPVVLTCDPETRNEGDFNYYHYTVEANVTAENGETETGTETLYASTRASWLESDWPSSICKEHLKNVKIELLNAARKTLDGEGTVDIAGIAGNVAHFSFKSGQKFTPNDLLNLPSGEYKLTAKMEGAEDLNVQFLLFSEKDTRPVGKDVCWWYVRPNEDGSEAFVMLGSPRKDVTVFYDVVAGAKLLETRRIKLDDSIEHFNLKYKSEYDEGAQVSFFFVQDGELYSHSLRLSKPAPNKQLNLQWSTFRSQLLAGQKETWKLKITRPNGAPADASLMACLYDASLDKFQPNKWDFELDFFRNIPTPKWTSAYEGTKDLYFAKDLVRLDEKDLDFTVWNQNLFDEYATNYMEHFTDRVAGVKKVRLMKMEEPVMELKEVAVVGYSASKKNADMAEADSVAVDSVDEGKDPSIRSNFAETAFFKPALRTDKNGEVVLTFTLPQSLTTWNFMGFAHDAAVNYGLLTDEIVARKDFMVESNTPRFVREGDRFTIPVTVRNLSEQEERGKVMCELLDARTEKVVATKKADFIVEKDGEKALSFTFDATNDYPVLLCRIIGEGKKFSDGEEKLIPVLADREQVIETVPFSMTEAGTKTLQLDTIWSNSSKISDRRLTIELSSNPTWYAVSALPVLANAECFSSPSWAERYYALSLAKYIADKNPEIRKAAETSTSTAWAEVLKKNPDLKQMLLNETPWVNAADEEAERASQLATLFDEKANADKIASAMDILSDMQRSDGGWGWFAGMPSNPFITSEVATLLARVQVLNNVFPAQSNLQRAMSYLKNEMAKRVKEMKAEEKRTKQTVEADELTYRYLYLCAILGMDIDADAKYLLDKIARPDFNLTMYGKAMSAITLAKLGKFAAANDNMESLLEHTVHKEGMGTYFDTDRAQMSWNAYRIPTQAAAIEAMVQFYSSTDERLQQMCLWLMQAKRTQMWPTSRATTDALFALLINAKKTSTVRNLSEDTPLYYTLRKGNNILAVNAKSQATEPKGVGYFRQSFDNPKQLSADNIQIRKTGSGLAWGAVFAQYTVPASDVKATGKGLFVERRFEVQRGKQWQPIAEGVMLKKGDRVRQVFTLRADRDYDFVSLKSSRSANLEPVEQRSGYTYRDGEWFYRVSRDASNEFFFEKFSKGVHTFTEEFFVDRSGTYHAGAARIQSQYAPEFTGTSTGATLVSE